MVVFGQSRGRLFDGPLPVGRIVVSITYGQRRLCLGCRSPPPVPPAPPPHSTTQSQDVAELQLGLTSWSSVYPEDDMVYIGRTLGAVLARYADVVDPRRLWMVRIFRLCCRSRGCFTWCAADRLGASQAFTEAVLQAAELFCVSFFERATAHEADHLVVVLSSDGI